MFLIYYHIHSVETFNYKNEWFSAAPCCYKGVITFSTKKNFTNAYILKTFSSYVINMSSQDVECDVSVEDDNRQEWIFTLYDFDNSGRVTKEVRLTPFYTPLKCLFV